jgi:hypothetical protein
MKSIREIYQALLDGKTLVYIAGDRITLDNSHLYSFSEPEKWEIYEPKWEMRPAGWGVSHIGKIYEAQKEVTENQKFGVKFHSEKQAEKARDKMKRSNLLRYWVSTMQDLDEGNYRIIYYLETEKYEVRYDDYYQSFAEVYMTEITARKICNALNNGELTL